MAEGVAFFDLLPGEDAIFRKSLGSGFKVTGFAEPLSVATAPQAAGAAVVCIRSSSKITTGVLDALPGLKHIACRTTGYDHVDVPAARAKGVLVTNVPDYSSQTLAEYTFLLMLAVTRKLMLSAHSVQFRRIVPHQLTGHQLGGKTLGIIGLGNIGRNVAGIARGFGMEVLAADVVHDPHTARRLGLRYVSLTKLLASSDYLTLHAPALANHRPLLGPKQFTAMKPGIFIINTARGSLIDTRSLLAALHDDTVAGAALDVVEAEDFLKLPGDPAVLDEARNGPRASQIRALEELRRLPNVLVTAHNASNTHEALANMRAFVVSNIIAWSKQTPQNEVS